MFHLENIHQFFLFEIGLIAMHQRLSTEDTIADKIDTWLHIFTILTVLASSFIGIWQEKQNE